MSKHQQQSVHFGRDCVYSQRKTQAVCKNIFIYLLDCVAKLIQGLHAIPGIPPRMESSSQRSCRLWLWVEPWNWILQGNGAILDLLLVPTWSISKVLEKISSVT